MVDVTSVCAVEVVERTSFNLNVRQSRPEREIDAWHGLERSFRNQVAAVIRHLLVADERPLALLNELDVAVDRHSRVCNLHALRHDDVEFSLRGVVPRAVEEFHLHRFKVRRTRSRERDAVEAVSR